ncbi:hypothetical protein [Lutispora thermophila]|uniref:TrbC/VIRB2 family protein n=1 Tax=Lutispora thermophila DSM 19022 TaxID=1122184 RepID=A0A1M6G1R8_9FIRM|nr:hypothetical protein [Lutispora thermophila]SHJ03896.1 hypothetical protein SAMN02745176_02174 [Lutispora thermophila DSM 19022]
MFDRIVNAFNPIIQLLQAVSYPLAFMVISLGVLTIMIGQKRRGMEVIKWAVVGYLLMQFLPGLMIILKDVGKVMIP